LRKIRLSSLAVALLAAFVASMFLVTCATQVVVAAQTNTNTMRVIVFAGQGQQALNDVMKSMKDLGASNVKKLQIINAVSGMVSVSAYEKLKARPEVSSITEDRKITYDPVTDGKGDGIPPAGKPYAVDPYVEPEALNITHSDWGQSLGYSGQGIKVAILDTGIDYKHPDLAPAIAAYIDTTGTGLKDNGGHGTGTASMIGAQGNYVYNTEVGQYMRVKGMAPDAQIYGAKVADKIVGWESNMIAAIEWAVANDVDIISCSMGTYDLVSAGMDAGSLAWKAAVDAGVTVFISGGNEGPGAGTVHEYSTARGIISVGASTMYREFSQIGFLNSYGGPWKNSQVITWSSRPPSADGRMSPDIMAPGAFGWALSPTYYLSATGMKGVQEFGGTSQAAPVAAGCTALLMSAYKKEVSTTLPGPAY
jgi:subtilisin family serine protease